MYVVTYIFPLTHWTSRFYVKINSSYTYNRKGRAVTCADCLATTLFSMHDISDTTLASNQHDTVNVLAPQDLTRN